MTALRTLVLVGAMALTGTVVGCSSYQAATAPPLKQTATLPTDEGVCPWGAHEHIQWPCEP
jgi:hypothetical protein